MIAAAGSAAALMGGSLFAGEYAKAVIEEKAPIEETEAWSFCDIFDMPPLYEGEGFIKSISIHGRYQGQYISQSEDIGSTSNGYHRWQHRRARLGFEIEMDHGLTFYAENNLADGEALFADRWQNDWQDFNLEWEVNDDFSIVIGKQKQDFTIEDAESSKRILTVERSAIVNETAGARPWGVLFGFEMAGFSNQVGAWLTGGDDSWGGWPDFNSNASASFNTKYEIMEGTDLRLDYVFNDNDGGTSDVEGDADRRYSSVYNHALAIGTDTKIDNFGLVTNAIFGWDREGSGGLPDEHDTYGFVVMPSYDLTDKLQLVARYSYMSEGREQRTQRFDERRAVSNYHTIYGGLNYHICEHNLKLMVGYEYATGDIFEGSEDIETGSWQFAVRTYF